jgi:hypothetical protein
LPRSPADAAESTRAAQGSTRGSRSERPHGPSSLPKESNSDRRPGQAFQLPLVESGPGKEGEIFGGAIVCIPDSEGPEPAEPYVEIQIVGDVWFTDLGPDDVATVAAALRAQADRLDHDVRPRLVAYRDDWTAHRAT